MAIISGVVLGIGKVVSGAVTGTAKGLAVAGKATAKGISATGKVVGKAASATGKAARASGRAIGKATRSTAKGLQKAVKSTKKRMSNFGKRMSKRKTGTEKLKRNANKTKSKLTENIKKIKKQRLDRERIQKNVLERKEIRNMERNIKSSKTPTGKKVQSVLKSPMSIIDKIFGLGGILLTGIVVNAIDDIIKKFKEFKENNQALFDNISKILTVIKDSFVFLFDQMTKPFGEEGALDGIAKFDDDGNLQSGILKDLEDAIKKLRPQIDEIEKYKKDHPEIAPKVGDYYRAKDRRYYVLQSDGSFKVGSQIKPEEGKLFKKEQFTPTIDMIKSENFERKQNIKKANLESFKSDNSEFKMSKIGKDNINDILNYMNIFDDNSTTYIIAHQKYKEYIPIVESFSGSNNEPLSDYAAELTELSLLWRND